MVEVRFVSVAGIEAGIKCTLDGVVKYTDDFGQCSFFGISQGAHSYSVEAPNGWSFVSGDDVFGSPLYESGITVIEWVPYPVIPWPEDQPWMLKFVFEEIPVGIPTTITINAPASVEPDEAFYITGTLYETNSGLSIPGHTVNISYNGVSLGNILTGIDGEYLLQAVIPTGGTYTLTASFTGTATLGASEASSKLRAGGIELSALLPVAALTLFAYTMLKR